MQSISIQCFCHDYHYDKTYFFSDDRVDIEPVYEEVVRMCGLSKISGGYQAKRAGGKDVARCLVTLLKEDGEFCQSDVVSVDVKRFQDTPKAINGYLDSLPDCVATKIRVEKPVRMSDGLSSKKDSSQKGGGDYDKKGTLVRGKELLDNMPDSSVVISKWVMIIGLVLLALLLIAYVINS